MVKQKRPPSRFRRQPDEIGPLFGFADLPVRFPGEIDGDGAFVEHHPCAHDISHVSAPWVGDEPHPRLATAREVFSTTLELELGLLVACAIVDRFSLTNALLSLKEVTGPSGMLDGFDI